MFRCSKSTVFNLTFGLLLGLLLFSGIYYALFQDSWFDEAANSYKPWLTAQHLALPFQDFVEKHPPVSFYSQVFWQKLFGPSILAYRLFSLIFLIGLALLLFDSLRRIGGRWLGLFGLSLLVSHSYAVGKFATATPDAMIGFFGLLSLWFLQLESWPLSRRVVFSSLAMSLAFLGRYNLLPALIILWLFILLRYRWRQFLLAVISSLVFIALLEIPYLLLDPEYALSFFFVMFGPLAAFLPLKFLSLIPSTEPAGSPLGYLFNESRLKLIMQVITSFFHLWALLLFGILLVLTKWKNNLRELVRIHPLFIWTTLLVVILFLAHFVFGPTQHKMYILFILPFLFFAAGYAAWLLVLHLRESGLWEKARSPMTLLAFSVLLLVPISVALSGNDIIFFNRWDYQDTDLQRIERGGNYLASLTKADDLILTIDNPDQVFLAGRLMIPERINRHDTYTDIPDEKLLARFNRYNTAMFLRWLKEDADFFVAQKGTFEARLEPIADKRGSEWLVAEVKTILGKEYQLVGSIAGVYPRKEERGAGVMEIYRHAK